MESLFYIYRHIRPDTNEVFYIGRGLSNTSRYKGKEKRNVYWRNIVNKNNGIFRAQIIMNNLSKKEADEKEKEFIALYGKSADGEGTLTNFQNGGDDRKGGKQSVDALEKKRLRSIGNKSRTGMKESMESKIKRISAGYDENGKWKGGNKKGCCPHENTLKALEIARQGNKSNSGRKWITNGEISKTIKETDIIPHGFFWGRILNLKNN